jgi:hypothetical protein
MVAADGSDGNYLSLQEGKCSCFIGLKLELQKAKYKILSYEKIIKVLHEELSNKNFLYKSDISEQTNYAGEHYIDQPRKAAWVVTENNSINNSFNNNQIQVIPIS